MLVAQELVDTGKLSREDAAQHRLRHVLTGALSARGDKIPLEFHRFELTDGTTKVSRFQK